MYGSNLSGDGRGLFPYMIPAWGLVCMMENNSAGSMSCDDLTYIQQHGVHGLLSYSCCKEWTTSNHSAHTYIACTHTYIHTYIGDIPACCRAPQLNDSIRFVVFDWSGSLQSATIAVRMVSLSNTRKQLSSLFRSSKWINQVESLTVTSIHVCLRKMMWGWQEYKE